MALGDVELREVEIVGLDIGTFRHRETHVGEDRGELVDHLADRMNAALLGRRLAHRQRDVDSLRVEALIERGALERFAAFGERLRHLVLEAVDERALLAPLGRRHGAERLEQRRDRAVAPERSDAHGFKRGFVGCRRDVSQDLLFELCDVGHGFWSVSLDLSCPALCRASTSLVAQCKTWMAGTSPAMTTRESWSGN